jgi:hypothetical protein
MCDVYMAMNRILEFGTALSYNGCPRRNTLSVPLQFQIQIMFGYIDVNNGTFFRSMADLKSSVF